MPSRTAVPITSEMAYPEEATRKPAGLREDLDILREEPIQLGVDDGGKLVEGLDRFVVRDGEAAADVDEVHGRISAVPSLLENVRAESQRLHVVAEVGGLAAHVEADALDGRPGAVGLQDEIDRFPRGSAEL